MTVSQELLKKLRSAFNLNIYEAKVWTALLSKGVATAGELSDMSNVPRSRSYDVLESLEKKGFIVMKLGRPIKYLAVQPKEIIKRVKKTIQDKAEEEVKSIDKLQGTDVDELALLYKNGIEHIDPTSIAGSFKGRNSLYNHILGLMSDAKSSVVIATTDDGLVRKVEYFKSTLRKLKQSKVNILIAAPLQDPRAKEASQELKEYAKVKSLDINSRFVVVDGKQAVFMINHDKNIHESADIGIWVNSPFFALSLKNMFDVVWNK